MKMLIYKEILVYKKKEISYNINEKIVFKKGEYID